MTEANVQVDVQPKTVIPPTDVEIAKATQPEIVRISNKKDMVLAHIQKNCTSSVGWLVYQRADFLFKQSKLTREVIFDKCLAFRDRLAVETGVWIPDTAPEGYPSVETSFGVAWANVVFSKK